MIALEESAANDLKALHAEANRVQEAALAILRKQRGEEGSAWLAAQEIRERFVEAKGLDVNGNRITLPDAWGRVVARRYLLNQSRVRSLQCGLLGSNDVLAEADIEEPVTALCKREVSAFREKVNALLWEGLEKLEPRRAMREALKAYLLTPGLDAATVAKSLSMSRNAFYLKKMRLMGRLAQYVREQLSEDERDDLERFL